MKTATIIILLSLLGYGAVNYNNDTQQNSAELVTDNDKLDQVDTQAYSKKVGVINDQEIIFDIADTDPLRQQGLSGRTELLDGTGMLFVFEGEPVERGFWMKDMLIDIDILWLDENYKIVHIEPNVLATSFPDIFKPNVNSQYVIELPANYTAYNDIVVGDRVEF